MRTDLAIVHTRPLPRESRARQEGDLEDAIAELRECQRLSGGATEATAFEWALIQAAGGNVREVEEYLQKQAESSPEIGPLVWEALAEETCASIARSTQWPV